MTSPVTHFGIYGRNAAQPRDFYSRFELVAGT